MDRKKIIQVVIKDLEKTLETFDQAYQESIIASKEAPSRMEARYDTSKEDMSRMAESIDRLAYETQKTLEYFQKMIVPLDNDGEIKEGSLVKVQDPKSHKNAFFFLVNKGGGRKVKVGDEVVNLISLESPFGKSLLHP